jgi:diguanylate cyclase (GGDEF)-like protein
MVRGVGGAVVGITALANAAGLHAAPHGLFLVAVAAYTITGMRAQQAVAAGLLILALQAAADLLTQRDLAEIAEPILFILSANVIGAATAVSHERAARTSFLRMKLLECRADLDGLTGIPNRRAFDRAAERAFQAAAREKVGVVFALFDVDRFKAFNDHLGHVAGDACLQRIARAFEATAQRPLDFAARIGGEEFAVIWYDASPQGALLLAKRVQGAVEALDIAHPEPESEAQVTVSGGAVYLHPRSQETLAAMAEADDALYEAKRSGRARVVVRVLDTN